MKTAKQKTEPYLLARISSAEKQISKNLEAASKALKRLERWESVRESLISELSDLQQPLLTALERQPRLL